MHQQPEGTVGEPQPRGGVHRKGQSYRETEAYRKALRKRAVWVEPLFGEAKEWHGLKRFRLRRLEKVNAEALMIASGQNVKRLLAFGTRGPRKVVVCQVPDMTHIVQSADQD